MATMSNRRSVMTLYSGRDDIHSHQVRMVLAEKAVNIDIIELGAFERPEDLAQVNPYSTLPTLLDRELVLYESRIIMEYLDERFPHPPLMPVYPVLRGKARLLMYRIERDWYELYFKIMQDPNHAEVPKIRTRLVEALLGVLPLFAETPFFFSEEFSMIDCVVVPLLWRLPKLNLELPVQAKPIRQYAKRMFERDAFQASLTQTEREYAQDWVNG